MSISFLNSRRFALTVGCSALALAAAGSQGRAGNLINGDSLLDFDDDLSGRRRRRRSHRGLLQASRLESRQDIHGGVERRS